RSGALPSRNGATYELSGKAGSLHTPSSNHRKRSATPASPSNACPSTDRWATSVRGSARRQQRVIGCEGLEMVALGAQTDVTVGPDDQQRRLADAQLVGCRWRKPRMPIVRACREHDRRFDQCPVAPTPDRVGEPGEIVVAR